MEELAQTVVDAEGKGHEHLILVVGIRARRRGDCGPVRLVSAWPGSPTGQYCGENEAGEVIADYEVAAIRRWMERIHAIAPRGDAA